MGIPEVEVVEFDARDIDSHGPLMDRIFASGRFDLAIVAFGVLDDEKILKSEPLRAANLASSTTWARSVSAVTWRLA